MAIEKVCLIKYVKNLCLYVINEMLSIQYLLLDKTTRIKFKKRGQNETKYLADSRYNRIHTFFLTVADSNISYS